MAIYRNQVGEIMPAIKNQFTVDVLQGLMAEQKTLQSKYFYDTEGDRLFQQIMASPEYYLTNCELEIFAVQTEQLANTFLNKYKEFDVIELGAGDAIKSSYLLAYLQKKELDFCYFPIDISKNVIHYLQKELPVKIPGLSIKGLNGEYFEMVQVANKLSEKRKLVLFLGSNIGNFNTDEAISFLRDLNNTLALGDIVLIGVDLKKNPHQILAAYNDKAGITKQFNLNLLKRINNELGADFDLNQFDHYATYNPLNGACKSFLISLKEQKVSVADETIYFDKNEVIDMELSQKYSVPEMQDLAFKTGFRQIDLVYDSNKWFVDVVWEKR